MTPPTGSLGWWCGAETPPLLPGEWAFRIDAGCPAAVSPLNPRGIPTLAPFQSSPWSAEISLDDVVGIPSGARVVLSLTGPGFEHRLRGRVDTVHEGASGPVAVISGTTWEPLGIPSPMHAGDDGVRLRLERWIGESL
ncbi:MAG: hypothetical protein ACK47B_16440 [Armatimonadota bacterium]